MHGHRKKTLVVNCFSSDSSLSFNKQAESRKAGTKSKYKKWGRKFNPNLFRGKYAKATNEQRNKLIELVKSGMTICSAADIALIKYSTARDIISRWRAECSPTKLSYSDNAISESNDRPSTMVEKLM